MTLQDAIAEVKKDKRLRDGWENTSDWGIPTNLDYAIATILNAVVKGELK